MASQQTPNYKLSRWAGTDRIMMEDFNRDNAAIDAALKGNAEAVAAETAAREAADTALGKKAGLQLIQTLTLATGSDYASAEINIDWSQWAEAYGVFQLEYKGSMKNYNLYFLPNDDYLVRTAYSTHVGAVFHPLFNENLYIEGTTFSGSAITAGTLYKDITGIGLSLTASSGKTAVISSGTTVKCYGRKEIQGPPRLTARGVLLSRLR